MWSAGISLPDMALQMKRGQEEVAVMVMDLAQNAVIGRRERGIFGGEEIRDGCKGAGSEPVEQTNMLVLK